MKVDFGSTRSSRTASERTPGTTARAFFCLFVAIAFSLLGASAALAQPIIALGADPCTPGDDAIYAIDLVSGDRTIVSGTFDFGPGCQSVGGGIALTDLDAIAPDAFGEILAASQDAPTGRLMLVDPVTGNRSVLSGCQDIDTSPGACTGALAGSGPEIFGLFALAAIGDDAATHPALAGRLGDVFAAGFTAACWPTSDFGTLFLIDRGTGDRIVISGDDETCTPVGSGDPFLDPNDVTVAPTGRFWSVTATVPVGSSASTRRPAIGSS